ncbi:hypothetical protein [Reinekea marinisedimentorum]|uniref:Uncharacterized protein n=1 Tax=Reinekea marinisedimentorum TaxID=230495 RepID=A0A4R3ICQ3_9GAMM|nr:hypothetical protein [Reinekea marinisedimentorum]TCS43346.1 hypothetical protein BCF53_102373 [Reinekea marinisedimentorum]
MKNLLLHKAWLAGSLCAALLLIFAIAYFDACYDSNLSAKNAEIAQANKNQLEKLKQAQQKFEQNKAAEEAVHARGFGDANLFQGIQVQIEGLNILDKFFNLNSDYDIQSRYGGELFHDTDNFILDPDKPNRGYPNLRVQVLQPQPFSHRSFFERLFDSDYSGPDFLEQTLAKSSKVDSFYWNVNGDSILVEQHALQFAVDVNTQYNGKYDDAGLPVNEKTNVFGRKLDNDWEWQNKRYPPVNIALSFVPKSPAYVNGSNLNAPAFAVAAVELIGIKSYSAVKESEHSMGADSDLIVGKTLPLYSEFSQLPINYEQRDKALYQAQSHQLLDDYINLQGVEKTQILNNELFGKKKYSILRIANIGTVSEGNIFIGSQKASEAYRFIFALHMFVYGDWKTKYTPLASEWGAVEEKALYERNNSLIDRALSGLFDTFIPTLGLGNWGQMIVLAGLLFLLLPFVPALLQIVMLLASFVRLIATVLTRLVASIRA